MANKELQSIHSKQAKLLTRMLDVAAGGLDALDKAIQAGDEDAKADAMFIVKTAASPALLTVVNNFLKQNGIEAQNDDTSNLNATEQLLSRKKCMFNINSIPADGAQ